MMEEDKINPNSSNDNDVSASSFNRKRARSDSDSDSAESKLARVDSVNSGSNSSDPEHARSEPDLGRVDSVPNSPDSKWIQDDLLNILDDSDVPAIQDLDSVIRSFEEEILVPAAAATEVTSFAGESQPDLGYLLEASDDELGLPPTSSPAAAGNDLFSSDATGSGAARFAEMLGFEMPNYDSFEYGVGGGDSAVNSGYSSYGYNDAGDFVSVGGLFDYSDGNCVADDFSAVQWQQESLSAL